MSIQVIIQSLADLVQIHDDLFVISEQKTEIIKEGSAEKLQKLLTQEQKNIHQLEQAEIKREEAVGQWLSVQYMPVENISITEILELVSNKDENQQLEQITIDLTNAITKLKQQEQLNQSLLQQSMQFVQLSLNVMNPTIKNLNYDKKKRTDTSGRSMFDSKA